MTPYYYVRNHQSQIAGVLPSGRPSRRTLATETFLPDVCKKERQTDYFLPVTARRRHAAKLMNKAVGPKR
jgi:hypothetical protein